MEEYECDIVKTGGYHGHLSRLRGYPNMDDALNELYTVGPRLYMKVLLDKKTQSSSPLDKQFQGWLSAYAEYIRDPDEVHLPRIYDTLNQVLVELANNVMELILIAQEKGEIVPIAQTREEQKKLFDVLASSLLSRGHNPMVWGYWVRAHRPVYLYSPVLAEMFMHTKMDLLPVSELRLPYPATEFVFPEGFFPDYPLSSLTSDTGSVYGRVTGALVLEEEDDLTSRPRLRIHVLGKNSGGDMNNICEFFLYKDSGHSVAQELEAALQPDRFGPNDVFADAGRIAMREHAPAYTYFIAASIIYATMPNADVILGENSPEYAAWAKEMAARKLNRHQQKDVAEIRGAVERPNRYLLGRSVRIIDRHEPEGVSLPGDKRASPRMHWRAGHFHLYWTGPKDGGPRNSVVKFVEPTIVNAPEGTTALDVSKAGMR